MTTAEWLPHAEAWPPHGTDELADAADPHDQHGNVFADEKGLVDRTLMTLGVRWTKLRWMPRSIRMRLFREIVGRRDTMPSGARTCWEGATVWLDEVHALIDAQPWQQRRRDTWTAVAQLLAESTRDGMRPLTEISHEAIATALDVSDRYVHTITRWLIERRLLGQLLSGTRFPRMDIPQDETRAEHRARLAREKAAEQARRRQREHAFAQARAELDAVRDGLPVPPSELDPYREFRAAQQGNAEPPTLINLASVYELRLPDDTPPPPEPTNVISLSDARQRRLASGTSTVDPHGDSHTAVTSGNPVGPKSSSPTPLGEDLGVTPDRQCNVDKKGRASRGSDKKGSTRFSGSHREVTRLSVAQRTAQALLRGPVAGWWEQDTSLPDKLTQGVTAAWLAREVDPLVSAGWDPLELAWHITTKGGQWYYLPTHIPNPPGWIRASLRAAIPAVRPSAKWAADEAAREGAELAEEREDEVSRHAWLRSLRETAQQRRHGRARRAAIDACDLCDEGGWLPEEDEIGVVRCNHDPETGGW
ncbi:hypothetical protein BS329_38830 [Amycolatopsis coloradensis]|uniref:Uncharacterized protein n=1 Tax=Amycolatopsis coloradensis TaxID=76021 RepID=A0A1R0KES2_9PSEU|nr:hypothetical protein [Amycolatopsis coloradensis]OLZ43615.1 hypothetical protein BS329_38830 [Amycolatopsis coloradensis]